VALRWERTRAENEVPGTALARICEPSRIDSGRSFHSQEPTELKDLSPNVRSLNNGAARLWPSADLREQECTLLFSRSGMMGIDHSWI